MRQMHGFQISNEAEFISHQGCTPSEMSLTDDGQSGALIGQCAGRLVLRFGLDDFEASLQRRVTILHQLMQLREKHA